MKAYNSKFNTTFTASFLLLLFLFTLIPSPNSYSQEPERTPAAKLISIQGKTSYSSDNAKTWSPAQIGQVLYGGDIIETGAYGRAAIILSDETQMKVHPRSQILIKSVQRFTPTRTGNTQLHVKKGQTWLRIKRPDTKFEVTTPISFAGIRGTEINVEMDEQKDESIVTVVDGSVEYGNDIGTIILSSGDQGKIKKGLAPTKTTLINPDDAVQWSLYYMGVTSYRDYPFISNDPAILEQKLGRDNLSPLEKAMIYHDLGRSEEALQTVQSASESAQKNTLLAWIYIERNELDTALTYLDNISQNTVLSHLARSIIYYRQHKIEKSLDTLREALKGAYSNSPRLLTQTAYLYLSRGLTNKARDYLNKAISSDPEYGLAYGLFSNMYIAQNKKDKAKEYAQKALQYSPHSPSALIDMSLVSQSYFDLKQAKEYARKAVDLDPKNAQALYQYAKILFGFGYNKKARQIILTALRYHPEDSLINSLYGFILFAQAETDESIKAFKKAITLDSTQGEPHLGLGLAYFRESKYLSGIEEMLIATLLAPKVSLFQSYLGKSYYQAKRFTEAEGALDYAKELDPNDPTPYLYSGNMKRDLYRYAESAEDIQKSIDLNDNRAVYRSRLLLDKDQATRSISLAQTYSDLGIFSKALRESIISLESDLTNGSAHLFFGNTLVRDPVRVSAAGSELFKAYFLMPVNQNVFNSFNDYTSMLEVPYNRLSLQQTVGSNRLNSQFVSMQGGSAEYAYYSQLLLSTGEGLFTDTNNPEKIKAGLLLGKFLINETSDLFVEYDAVNLKSESYFDFLDTVFDTDYRPEAHDLTLAYHKNLAPGSDLLFLGEVYYAKVIEDTIFTNPFDKISLITQDEWYSYNLQGSHILNLGRNQLQYGFGYFYRDITRTISYKDLLFPIPIEAKDRTTDNDIFFNVYLKDIYTIWDGFDLSLGGEFKYLNRGNVKIIDENSNLQPGMQEKQFNPMIGFKHEYNDQTLFRGAAFRTLQDTTRTHLGPVQVSGFVLPGGVGTTTTTDKKEYDLGVEHDFNNTTFGYINLRYRDAKTPFVKIPNPEIEHVIYKQSQMGFEKIVNKYLSLGLYYTYNNINTPLYDREDHIADISLTFNFGNGWTINLIESYVDAHYTDVNSLYQSTFQNDYAYITSLNINKELPQKIGAVNLYLYNLLDEEFSFERYPGDVISVEQNGFYWAASIEFRF